MLHRFRFPTGVTQIRRQKPPCCRFPTGITQVCRQIHASYRFRPPSPGLVLPSEELELRQRLDEFRLDKWNFVVYRCSYGDEKLWADFKDIWTREVRRHIAESDAPELGQSLTWTFFDDARTFTDVSKDELRRHFRDWASFAPAVEQPRAREPWCSIYSPRYRFFIHVDHEAMQSVLDHPQPAIHLEEGHVNLVDSKWRLEVEDSENEEDYDSLDHTYPPIDGCTSQEVGWMKMQYSRVAPETYNLLSFDDYAWYDIYVRPPEMLPY